MEDRKDINQDLVTLLILSMNPAVALACGGNYCNKHSYKGPKPRTSMQVSRARFLAMGTPAF